MPFSYSGNSLLLILLLIANIPDGLLSGRHWLRLCPHDLRYTLRQPGGGHYGDSRTQKLKHEGGAEI